MSIILSFEFSNLSTEASTRICERYSEKVFPIYSLNILHKYGTLMYTALAT